MALETELIIFDVNETLLDMSPLQEEVNKVLGNELAAKTWFTTLLYYSLVESVTGTYHDFSEIAHATLKMTGQSIEIKLPEDKIKSALSGINSLPPHSEVKDCLENLDNKGYRLVALSNGKPEVVKQQVKNAGIELYFEDVISVEYAKKYKPHSTPYNFVLKRFNVAPEKALMVAAHAWDIMGAHNTNMKTAFIKRPGKAYYPLAPEPTFVFDDLTGLVKMFK